MVQDLCGHMDHHHVTGGDACRQARPWVAHGGGGGHAGGEGEMEVESGGVEVGRGADGGGEGGGWAQD